MTMNIDVLYLLVAAEALLVFFIATVYLLVKNKKYRNLYQKALKDLSNARTVPKEAPSVKEEAAEVFAGEPAFQEQEQPSFEAAEVAEITEAAEDMDDGSLKGKIQKLQRVVSLQKDKILDLMCYKDFFEGAQKKLSSIQSNNQDLHEKIRDLGETCENKEEFAGAVSAFENNNRDLGAFINILEKENVVLSEKFRAWEEELKKLWEENESAEGGTGIDEGKQAELLREKDELISRLREFEGQLQDKSNQLEDMQKQYEDIEREYMILYKQQQQQQGNQPAI